MYINRSMVIMKLRAQNKDTLSLQEIERLINEIPSADVVPAIFHELFARVESKEIARLRNRVEDLEGNKYDD